MSGASGRIASRGQGLLGAASGTGLIAAARGLPAPWQSIVTFAAPTVTLAWIVVQPLIVDGIIQWRKNYVIKRLRKMIETVRTTLSDMPAGEARDDLEAKYQKLLEALASNHIHFVKAEIEKSKVLLLETA